jgi:hypothetical protein
LEAFRRAAIGHLPMAAPRARALAGVFGGVGGPLGAQGAAKGWHYLPASSYVHSNGASVDTAAPSRAADST